MMETVAETSTSVGFSNATAHESVNGSEADTDSIGSGPENDSNGSERDNGNTTATVTSADQCRSDICATVSIATTTGADPANVDNGRAKTTSMFVDPIERGEITRPVGWLTPSSSQPAILQTQNPPRAIEFSSSLGPTRCVTLSSPLPSFVGSLRSSAITAIKRTRQNLSEKFGHGSKTIDTELETRIDSLRGAQSRYGAVLQLTNAFITHFNSLVASQQALGSAFAELSQKMPELHDEFLYNAETQRAVYRNGETLLVALNFFMSTVNTLCFKTIDDTLLTVKQYEEARVEYDAYRCDVESRQPSADLQKRFELHKQKFERLRQVLDIKLKFLDENKVKVMHQQLILFHNAIAAYFSGNQQALEETLQQFNIKLRSPNSGLPSWIESRQQQQ